MSAKHLAILGGSPIRTKPFPAYNTIGPEEKQAVNRVLDSGVLSEFLGTWSSGFYGGPYVRKLEEEWAARFGVKHAISVNSATSGLYAAVAASGVGPGDEVIVSPYTMSSSAVGALIYGATPVFADIDPETYCISADTIRKVLTPRTKAVIVVDLFGHPADYDEINQIAREHNLVVIEDAAQAPAASYKGRWAGCLGHIGVFSLNYHKTIQCGEGGIVVTNDDELADRVCLVRNHGETVVEDKGATDLANLIGYNYRMTEIEAAISAEQLKKLDYLTKRRVEAAQWLSDRWGDIPGITPASVRKDCRHVYYLLALQFEEEVVRVPRDRFVEAVCAEGVPFSVGYVKPLYLQPIYQQRAFPSGRDTGSVSYDPGICPTAEAMHYDKVMYTMMIHANLSRLDLEDVARAVEKVALESRSLAA